MLSPDWQQFALAAGILREPSPDKRSLVIWLPRGRDGGAALWERLSTVTGSETALEGGVCAVAAVSLSVRQKAGGMFSKFFGRGTGDGQTWVLPNGASAEQVGERRSDLAVVYSDGAPLPDDAGMQALFPGATAREPLGERLMLIRGAELAKSHAPAAPQAVVSVSALPPTFSPSPAAPMPAAATASAPAPRVTPPPPPMNTGNPRQQATQLLAAARQTGDRRREANALLDLGVVCHRTGDSRSGAGHLQQALALAREIGDQALESDAQGNLGMALLALKQPAEALQLIVDAVSTARASGNEYQLKQALDNIGNAYGGMRQSHRALECFAQALDLTRKLGDRAHEADLLWCCAIQYADLRDREQTLIFGEAAINICRELGNPYAELLAEHLQKYADGADALPAQPDSAATPGSPGAVVGGWGGVPPGAPGPAGTPGPLRMAYTAFKSFAKFLGGGLKTLPQAARDQRLAVCATCEHHTGVRCRLCGCFTAVKTWLPHEKCPAGKW